jgi:tight adherence protein B
MSHFLAKDYITIPLLTIMAFTMSYLWADRLLAWLHRRSLGQREEVLRLMELMFVETDQRQVTIAMLASSFGLGAVVFLVAWPNLWIGLIGGSIITIAMWSVPKMIANFLWESRCGTFVNQMIDGMTLMANGVKAGLSVQQSMERISENLPNPIAQEFGLVLSQMRIGRSMQDALNELAIRIPRPDVQMFVTSVNILQETGGNMAETFQTIVFTVRERQKVEKKIEALTAQGVTQGVIVTMVPFLLLGLFAFVDPKYVEPLFSTALGWVALLIVLGLQIIGGLAIRKIVNIDV